MLTKLKLLLTLTVVVMLHSLSYGQTAGAPYMVPNRTLTEVTFEYTGAIQTWIVPAGVTEIFVDVIGAQGGDFNATDRQGGAGGRVRARLAVTAGNTLYITVGGKPEAPNIEVPRYGFGGKGGFVGNNGTPLTIYNRAGAGGGLSGIFNSATILQSNALVIAAGGGGATGGNKLNYGGAAGGLGGFTGGYNTTGGTFNWPLAGTGGTQTTGGLAGWRGNVNVGDPVYGDDNTTEPQAGSALKGGDGGVVNPTTSTVWNGGGGGGAGYFGGGGGRAGGNDLGAGGGGSSWTAPAATGVTHISDFNKGNGRVIIRYK